MDIRQRLKPLETTTKKFISLQRMLHMACNITRKKIQFAIIFKYERIIQVFLRGMHVFSVQRRLECVIFVQD